MSLIPHVIRRNGRYSYRRRLPSPFHHFRPITVSLGTATPLKARRLSAHLSVAFEELIGMCAALTDMTAEEAYAFFRHGLERELAKAIETYEKHSPNEEVCARANRVMAGSIALALQAHEDPVSTDEWPQDIDEFQPVYRIAQHYLDRAEEDARAGLLSEGKAISPARIGGAVYQILRGRLAAHQRTENLSDPSIRARGHPLVVLLDDTLFDGRSVVTSATNAETSSTPREEAHLFLEQDTRRFSAIIPIVTQALQADGHWGVDVSQRQTILRTFAWLTGDKRLCDYRPSDIEGYKSALQRIPTTHRWDGHQQAVEYVLASYPTIPTTNKRNGRTLNRDLSTMERVAKHLSKSSWKPRSGHGRIMDFSEHYVEIKENPLEPERVPWTVDHLKAFFSSRVYLGGGGTAKRHHATDLPTVWHDATYWVPVIAAYAYMSREEICGLECEDIVSSADRPYIAVRRNMTKSKDGHTADGLKNLHRDRIVPIHPELIRLGFLEYVEAVTAEGHAAIFPELYQADLKVRGGKRFWQSSFRYQVDAVAAVMPLPSTVSGKDADFHSFRTYGASHAETTDVKQAIVDLLFGHASAGTNLRKYGRARLTLDEAEYLERLHEGLVTVAPIVTGHLFCPPKINLLPLDRRSRTGSAPGRRASLSKADRRKRDGATK